MDVVAVPENELMAQSGVREPVGAGRGHLDVVRLALRFNLHPEDGVHSSWLPPDWPPGRRLVSRFGAAGRVLLGKYLRQWGALDSSIQFDFDSRRRRLALLDGRSLRLLAAYCGLCAHKPLFDAVATSHDMHRLARRIDHDAARFVIARTPALTGLVLSKRLAPENPLALGTLVMDRGYRMLLGVLAVEGDAVLQRVLRKLPRRVASLKVPVFRSPKLEQVSELIFLCLIPERMPQWDWLF